MVFKRQDLTKFCELMLINSHCKKEINAKIQCIFLYLKDSNKNLEDIKKAIDLKINDKSFEIKQLELYENKIIIDFNDELFIQKLELNTSLKIDKIKLYKRKIKGLIIAARDDAFAARMWTFATAMYLASKTGFKFGFVWYKIHKDIYGITLESAEELFEEEFLKEHCYNGHLAYQTNMDTFTSADYHNPWGYFVDYSIVNKINIINDFDEEEFKKISSNHFFNLPFKTPYKNAISIAYNTALKLENFVAIHMRGGDAIETIRNRNFIFSIAFYIFPVDLAIFSIRHFLKQGLKVVLFSADTKACLAIKEYLNDEVLADNFFIACDFYKNLNTMQTIIFDMILMSKANKILANYSSYSKFAHLLGQGELLDFNTYFNQQELYNAFIIPKQKDFINISSVQKTASCVYAYLIARNIGVGFNEKIKLLNLALEFDINNCAIRIIIIDEFFKQGYITRVENYLKTIINERYEDFITTLFLIRVNTIIFKKQFAFYLHKANENFPYICFVAAKIAEFNKDFKESLIYIDLALQKEKDNELFLNLHKTLCKNLNIADIKQIKNQKIYNQYLISLSSAKTRIHNHLAYRLGSLMIRNSKSFLAYMKMPYLLMALILIHKEEQKTYKEKIKANPNLVLPPLETYKDYKEALKEKECFTYKLGEAFIKAHKNWYGGGYLRFFFKELPRLKREFKNKED